MAANRNKTTGSPDSSESVRTERGSSQLLHGNRVSGSTRSASPDTNVSPAAPAPVVPGPAAPKKDDGKLDIKNPIYANYIREINNME